MRILVTGGAGFIGSSIVDAYIDQGHEVTIVDDLSSGKKENLNPKARFQAMDVRDPNLSSLFEKSKFDIVNHLAAQLDVRKSVLDPFFDASVNILGTLRLLECSRAYGVKKFIFSSSGGTIYGECDKGPASEEAPSRPESPYGFSKAAAETYIRFYGSMYGVGYTILRYGNVYGPRQDPHGEAGVVAIFAGKLLAQQPITIYGTGKQVRDYVFVEDVVEANLAALSRGNNDTFNIGTQKTTSVNDLYAEMARLAPSAKPPTYAPARAGELEVSVLNIARAAERLGWKPKRTLKEGLDLTYKYFHEKTKKSS